MEKLAIGEHWNNCQSNISLGLSSVLKINLSTLSSSGIVRFVGKPVFVWVKSRSGVEINSRATSEQALRRRERRGGGDSTGATEPTAG